MKYIFRNLLAAACLGCAMSGPVSAHEFWLDLVDYTPKPGARVPIVHRTGINFLGDSYPYLRSFAKRFSVTDARGERPIKAVEGDDPAAEVTLPNAGLAIIVYQRAPDVLIHPTLERFTEIVEVEGLAHIPALHRAAGLPPTAIRETYARFAKALIKVGNGRGSDPAHLHHRCSPFLTAPKEPSYSLEVHRCCNFAPC